MLKKESAILRMAKVIVIASSLIGIVTIWGVSYYALIVMPAEDTQAVNSRVVLTQSACAKSAANKISQGDCYLKVARTRRDETICAKVEVVEMKALCYVELAELKNDARICENNQLTPSLLGVCRDYFHIASPAPADTDGAADDATPTPTE